MQRHSETSSTVLPVFKTLEHSYVVLWKCRKELIKWLTLPFVLLTAVDIFSSYFSEKSVFLEWGFFAVEMLLFTLFAVYCHRIVILGNKHLLKQGLQWSNRETRFLGWTIGIQLMIGFAMFAASTLMTPIFVLLKGLAGNGMLILFFLLAFLPASYLLARLSLVFPSTAVDERPDIKTAWELSGGNGVRLLIIITLYLLLLMAAISGLALLIFNQEISWIGSLLFSLIYYLAMILAISALSISYIILRQKQAEPFL